MYKVMLIDDDVPMLKVLQQMINWEAMQLQIVAATYSSVKAVHLFAETTPDIVITDIGLPQKNGIELAELFSQQKPDIRLIFLTCHEDFNYAQQAVRLNADDYLIKDGLTEEQLKLSLQKSVQLLKTTELRMDHHVSNYNSELYRSALLQRIIDGVNVKSILDYATQIGVKWTYPHFLVGFIHLHPTAYLERYQQKDLELIMYGIYNIAEEIAIQHEAITVFMEQDSIVVIYNYRSNLVVNHEQHMKQFLEEVREQCFIYFKMNVHTISIVDQLALDQLSLVYKKVMNQSALFYAEPNPTIAHVVSLVQSNYVNAPNGMISHYKSRLEQAVLAKDTAAIQTVIGEMINIVTDHHIYPKEVVQLIADLLRSIELTFLGETEEDLYYFLTHAKNIEDIKELLGYQLLQVMKQKQKTRQQMVKEPKLQVIQQYIDQNIGENMTSIDIARFLYLNPSYFSRYFKRLTGLNFTDYVHQYKMKLAADMLVVSSQTLEAISLHFGYSDRTYFSKVFKKYMGMTPSEYKVKNNWK
ncbi:response regulator [Paenibacillus yanchengensis]|uniref:Response regulator n=1 Tax=Paenibacillus yanchengensis TaxID=2035833 RepID=A0ABW4YHC7_9BACL